AAGILPLLLMSIHQPFTMFWPTDEALSSLPADRQRWLSSPDHREQVAATIKGHIVRNVKLMGVSQPGQYSSYRSMHGSTISYSCDKTLVGGVLINGNAARVVERFLTFRGGVAYGIDQLLEPPGLGAHCDGLENRTTYGRCGNCFSPPSCPFRHEDMGKTEPCPYPSYRHSRYFRPPYHLGEMRLGLGSEQTGCKRVCQFSSWIPQCCKNRYGRDCE
uniref:stabilin-1-like n=1 Tax=Centroberyx gerrardi TaxID=166262 RepID=UPI003AAC7902